MPPPSCVFSFFVHSPYDLPSIPWQHSIQPTRPLKLVMWYWHALTSGGGGGQKVAVVGGLDETYQLGID